MSSTCFVTQEATKDILLRVTNVCAECYDDIKEGDIIHYDMQSYRYLCISCQEKLCESMNEQCEVIEDDTQGLF
ncbi:MAG: Unknown protein [uncultured Sulfurovum sp.]|uniref:Uncharacterized protein n=1 Tax=uncultured Sulfurovum sp. TaxID=269237 RepID=A0A6S6U1K2_9BACT|nr:MAG: Unknown protein [uncultured Sulfurovum sp.]